jgi:undecaprenyl-diphosphooligosaccharide--protein glycosyltransferase
VPDNQDKEPKSLGEESESSEISSDSEMKSALGERGFFARKLELPKDRSHWIVTLLFIVLAYGLSVWIRYTWIDFAEAQYVTEAGETEYFRPQMVRDGLALPNTHDSFYFGTIIQKALHDRHQDNHLIPSVYENGAITYLPYLLLKAFPDSLTIEELLLKFPVWVAGLVCIPIVLIGRFYGSSLWGFFAACLAGVAHSYYNRTLAGYYDTDM